MLSSKLRNYTCDDENLQTSKPVRIVEIGGSKSGYLFNESRYTLNILLEQENSKNWFIEDFITESNKIIIIIVIIIIFYCCHCFCRGMSNFRELCEISII